MIDWSATAAMIAASVAFFSLIVSPIVSYKIAKKQIEMTFSSNERKEWVYEVRGILSWKDWDTAIKAYNS